MLKSDLGFFVLISLVGAVLFGAAAWGLAIALKRTQSVGKRVLIGIFLGVFGLIALAFSACGVFMIRG